jgi:hypothetical protein
MNAISMSATAKASEHALNTENLSVYYGAAAAVKNAKVRYCGALIA